MSSPSTYKRNFKLIIHRPFEPIFARKGPNGERFNIPKKFYGPRYQDISDKLFELQSQISGPAISIKDIKLPDLKFASRLPRLEVFSPCIQVHRKIADKLMHLLMECEDIDELQSMAIYIRDRVNPYCFNYALTIVLLHRTDTKMVDIPYYYEIFPEKFITAEMFSKIRQESGAIPEGSRIPIVQPLALTANFSNVEQKCAYFREDFLLNLSYWNWNIMYPSCISHPTVLNKDRRGELFFYYHHQIIARYNAERFCNKLHRVEPLTNLRDPIPEGYFSKLDSQVGGNAYPPRFKNTILKDLRRETDELHCDLYMMERWIDRIVDAIEVGFIINDKGERVNLRNNQGINILGDLIQASLASPNRLYYGDLGQIGKLFIAYSHDSYSKHLESFGVLADNATALRDPLFYRWHARLNELFMLHKSTLPPYTPEELSYPNVKLVDLEIMHDVENVDKNVLLTHWQQVDADAGPGLNFSSPGGVYVRLTHLDYQPFRVKFKIENNDASPKLVTVRLFLVPEFNEYGLKMNYQELRQFMIEIDRFVTQVSPGLSSVTRKSEESSIVRIRSKKSKANIFCRSGWPGHLLIPKGDVDGMSFILFAILSDYTKDQVNVEKDGEGCKTGSLYYGMFREKFPDKKPMGFPFDRRAPFDVEQLSDFLLPNMKFVNVIIKNKLEILPP